MTHCWCFFPFQFPLNVSGDKAAPTLCLEGDGRNNTFFSILAYATLNQISHSLQTPFPKGKKPSKTLWEFISSDKWFFSWPDVLSQQNECLSLNPSLRTQKWGWLARKKKKKRVLSRYYFTVWISKGFCRGPQGCCLSLLGFAIRAGSASQPSLKLRSCKTPSAWAEWATRDSNKSHNQGTAVSSFGQWELHELGIAAAVLSFEYSLGAAFRGNYAEYTELDEAQDDLEGVGRNVRVRQVPRKAFERCVTDGTVKGTALAVGKILMEEMAAPRGWHSGFRAHGGLVLTWQQPPRLVLLAGSTQGIPSLLTGGLWS